MVGDPVVGDKVRISRDTVPEANRNGVVSFICKPNSPNATFIVDLDVPFIEDGEEIEAVGVDRGQMEKLRCSSCCFVSGS